MSALQVSRLFAVRAASRCRPSTPLAFTLAAAAALTAAGGAPLGAVPLPAGEKQRLEKAIKEFVGKVVTAYGKEDVDALVEMSEVPFVVVEREQSLYRDKDSLRNYFKAVFQEKPPLDPKKHKVRRIETFRAFKARLGAEDIPDVKGGLAADDVAVEVEVDDYPGRGGTTKTIHFYLFIRIKEGKPRYVGLAPG